MAATFFRSALAEYTALRSLVADMPSIYTIPVKRLLCAFIRNPTYDASPDFNVEDQSASSNVRVFRDDVEAALEAVTQRGAKELEHERNIGWMHNMAYAKLPRLFLMRANFANCNLSRAGLDGSTLVNADFSNAILASANLSSAELGGSNFLNVQLFECNLSGTKFVTEARREDWTAELQVARNLTQAQLDLAIADPHNPPILDGVIDAETGEQLVWRGRAPST